MPQQIRLDLDPNDDNDVHPNPTMAPECKQHLITLMAQAIVAVWQREQEGDHESR